MKVRGISGADDDSQPVRVPRDDKVLVAVAPRACAGCMSSNAFRHAFCGPEPACFAGRLANTAHCAGMVLQKLRRR